MESQKNKDDWSSRFVLIKINNAISDRSEQHIDGHADGK